MKTDEEVHAKRVLSYNNGSQPRAINVEDIHLQTTIEYVPTYGRTCELCGVRQVDHHWEAE